MSNLASVHSTASLCCMFLDILDMWPLCIILCHFAACCCMFLDMWRLLCHLTAACCCMALTCMLSIGHKKTTVETAGEKEFINGVPVVSIRDINSVASTPRSVVGDEKALQSPPSGPTKALTTIPDVESQAPSREPTLNKNAVLPPIAPKEGAS